MYKKALSLLLALTMILSLVAPTAVYAGESNNEETPVVEQGSPEGICEHTYGDWIIDQEAEIGTDGLRHRECTLCGDIEHDIIPALVEETTPPVNEPNSENTCDHEFGDWQVVTEPTTEISGLQVRECILCGIEETDIIPALEENPENYPHGDGIVFCPHGKMKGELCYECGILTNSDKNIPMLGYDMDFFTAYMTSEDMEDEEYNPYNLFSCRLICHHGVADGLYCDRCGGYVDVNAEDMPSCWWFDSCIHSKIHGEKCADCQEMKQELGDYELVEGETWDDPMIFGAETQSFVYDISYIFNQYRYCIWCDDGNRIGVSRVFNDAHNVLCHVDSNGKYHWDYIARVEGSGTCESHDTTIVYQCGARESYSTHHSHPCTYGDNLTEHSEIIQASTCQTTGKKMTYYTATCVNCGAESSPRNRATTTIEKLPHLYASAVYQDTETHLASCSGNNTAAHQDIVDHNFVRSGEDYLCSDCDAAKTTIHIDAYSKNGTLLKADLLSSETAEVGHNGPTSVSVSDYQEAAYKAASTSGFIPEETQDDVQPVQLGGIHLKYYCSQITSIEVKDYKETYYHTDDFVDQGTIIVHFIDGTTKEVPLIKERVTDGFDTTTVGTKTLTVSYMGMSTTCDIEVLWIPAKIKVEVPDGYAQSKLGKIEITGDGDYVTMPDGSEVPCGQVDTYLFTENGEFPFTVTGMDKGTDSDTVNIEWIDTNAPILSVELKDEKLIIASFDDMSGLKTITYLETIDNTDTPKQHIGEGNKKILNIDINGVASGVYRIVATDYAGNSRNFDIAINVDTKPNNTPFSMYVPSTISFYVDKDGVVTYLPEDTKIYNYPGDKPIVIKAITVQTTNGWTLVDYDTDFSQYEEDSSYVALSINGNKVLPSGTVNINPEDWVIAGQNNLPLVLDIKVPKQTEARELPNVMKLSFTGDWYEEDEIIGQRQTISIMENEKCTYNPNVSMIYTNEFGKITYLPRVIVNSDQFTFTGWVNAVTEEPINVGQVLTEDITIKPIIEGELVLSGTVKITPETLALTEGDVIAVRVDWEGCSPTQDVKSISTGSRVSLTTSPFTTNDYLKDALGIPTTVNKTIDFIVNYNGKETHITRVLSSDCKIFNAIEALDAKLGEAKISGYKTYFENNVFVFRNNNNSTLTYTITEKDEVLRFTDHNQEGSGRKTYWLKGQYTGNDGLTIKMTDGQSLKNNITITEAVYHQVTFKVEGNGTVGSSTIQVKHGTTWNKVQLPTITPDTNNYLDGFYINNKTIADTFKIEADTTVTVKFTPWKKAFFNEDIVTMGYGDGKYVLITEVEKYSSDTRTIYTYNSTDGVNWTKQNSASYSYDTSFEDIGYGNGTFVLMGITETGNSYSGYQDIPYICYSTTGTSWNGRSIYLPDGTPKTAGIQSVNNVVYYKNKFITSYAQNPNIPTFLVSSYGNGWGWGSYSEPSDLYSSYILCTNGSTIVGVQGKKTNIGSSTKQVVYSTNGTSWTRSTLRFSKNVGQCNGVAYGNNKYVAIFNDGTLAYSSTGSSWSTSSIPLTVSNCAGIVYANGKFVVLDSSAKKIYYSTDLSSWKELSCPTGNIIKTDGARIFILNTYYNGKAISSMYASSLS